MSRESPFKRFMMLAFSLLLMAIASTPVHANMVEEEFPLKDGAAGASVTVPIAGTCAGDGGYSCPARDPVNVAVRDGYDPGAVNWGAVVADIIQIGTHEPRFCNMVIRSWFHDVSGFSDNVAKFPFDGSADGSFITDFEEIDLPDGALHGFAQFSRHVILQLAAAHGASHADVLTVAAAKCTTEVLGGTVDIASHCEAVGFPLYMGKMDFSVSEDYKEWMWTGKSRNAPTSHDKIGKLVEFFMKEINGLQPDVAWRIKPDEIMAMMGAHSILMTHACTTTGEQTPEGSPMADMGDRTCAGQGGRQRMFTWDNSFFKDVTAGSCFQMNELTEKGDFTAKMTPQEHQAFTQCGFNSMEGFELSEQLECKAMESAIAKTLALDGGKQKLIGIEKFGPFNEGWQHVVWDAQYTKPKIPINESAPCCGFQCQTCEEDPESKFWCKGPIATGRTTRMWPYTYMDCDFNKLINLGPKGYCDGRGTNAEGKEITCKGCRVDCMEKWAGESKHPVNELVSHLGGMESAMNLFRTDSPAWEKVFATAFCKLSNFGASYAPGKASFEKLFSGPTKPCLSVGSVLSVKECEGCSLDKYGELLADTPLAPVDPVDKAEEEEETLSDEALAPVEVEATETGDLSLQESGKEKAGKTSPATGKAFWNGKFSEWRQLFADRRAAGARR